MPVTTQSLRRFVRADSMVAAGILTSRLAGLVRTTIFSYYFGLRSDAADAFNAAVRIPNLLQNLFGEGALSGSFIPVYAGLRAQGRDTEASQVARTIFALLMLVMAVLVLAGVLATPLLLNLIAPGFAGVRRELAVRLVRILFPAAGLLVAAAWCLGVLNSHHKFLLSYASGAAWNAGMIGALVLFGPGSPLEHLAVMLAWGSVVGAALQFAVQAPTAFRLSSGGTGLALTEPVRRAVRDFFPVLTSRGAVQISAYIDTLIASWLPVGAVTGLQNASLLYTLPVSLFGISVSAAELPALSGVAARAETDALRTRMDAALQRLTFFTVPSAVAFALLGDVIAGALLQHGRFRPQDSLIVWGILAGSAIGLVAATQSRLYSVAHYAIGDTRSPLRFALIRLAFVTLLGWYCALRAPGLLGIAAIWGAAGLTASAGVSGWIEFLLLRRSFNARVGHTGVPAAYTLKLWSGAIVAAVPAYLVKMQIPVTQPLARGAAVLPLYGGAFLLLAVLLHIPIAGLRRRR
ncbi:MAG TPA: murein biosynthesis integral membrane protein MurJ [Vicinamibacterales bacterium]|nr:murein biosynthesis integral membrane protein MurJ [Vicinamibacterales bacterium]